MRRYQGVPCAFWETRVEKVNCLSSWSLSCRLFIFDDVVIAMRKGSVTVVALPWLAQLGGRREGGTGTELLSQPGMAGMGVPWAAGRKHWRHTGGRAQSPPSLGLVSIRSSFLPWDGPKITSPLRAAGCWGVLAPSSAERVGGG